ncbi:hypothetical protein [Jiangella mangrovi]|uniref:Uncharacterized protein n=1 Tax=Jiangella mangrovi TaxID=1524084 RepID=A0A7W9GY40_9ACTN|nr:hypothetical protein [Jiangella mangrovi]MBB5791781.1 hypothetical protein [Jiangella mangrovi]
MSTNTVQIDAADIIRRQAQAIADLTTQLIQLELTAEALRTQRDEALALAGNQQPTPLEDDLPRVQFGGVPVG